jgi:hypothetical protein
MFCETKRNRVAARRHIPIKKEPKTGIFNIYLGAVEDKHFK